MPLHQYFADTPTNRWSINSFRRFLAKSSTDTPSLSTSSSTAPPSNSNPSSFLASKQLFSAQLSHIIDRHTPYESSPREWRSAALKLKDAGKKGIKARQRARKVRAVAGDGSRIFTTSINTSTNSQVIIGGNIPGTVTSNVNPHPEQPLVRAAVSRTASPTPSSPANSTTDESVFPPETVLLQDHSLTIGTLLETLRQSPPSAATLKLIAEVEQGVVFVRHVAPIVPKAVRSDLRNMMPKLDPAPSGVVQLIAAYTDVPVNTNIPNIHSDVDPRIAAEIRSGAEYVRLNLPTLMSLSGIAGETWWVVNVWGRLLDSIFVLSNTIILNRSELVPHSHPSLKCDGLIVPIVPPTALQRYGVRQLELGFVEVKSLRAVASGWEQDELKIVKMMRASLLSIVGLGCQLEMQNVVVVGVLCVGTQLRVYRATTSCTGGVCFFDEECENLELGNVRGVMQLVWRLKATVERTHRDILTALAKTTDDEKSREEDESDDNA